MRCVNLLFANFDLEMKLVTIAQLQRVQCRLKPQFSTISFDKYTSPSKIINKAAPRNKIKNGIQSHSANSCTNLRSCMSFDSCSSSFQTQNQCCCFSSSQKPNSMKQNEPRSAYSILNLHSNATKEDIKTSFRKVCVC